MGAGALCQQGSEDEVRDIGRHSEEWRFSSGLHDSACTSLHQSTALLAEYPIDSFNFDGGENRLNAKDSSDSLIVELDDSTRQQRLVDPFEACAVFLC